MTCPDMASMRVHLEQLFGRCRSEYPEGLIEIAYSDPHSEGCGKLPVNKAVMFSVTEEGLDAAVEFAFTRNNERRNVYVGVNPRKPGTPSRRATDSDIEIAFVAFADLDRPECVEKLANGGQAVPITMSVTTGRTPNLRVHPYWHLEEPVRNLSEWARALTALESYFGSDSVHNPSRVLKLAGSISYPSGDKAAKGYIAEQVTIRTEYTEPRDPSPLTAFFAHYGDGSGRQRQADDTSERSKTGLGLDEFSGSIDPKVCIKAIRAEFDRHNNTRDLVAWMVGVGHRDWLIHEFCSELLRGRSDGGTASEIGEFIRSAREKYNAPNPAPEQFDAEPLPSLCATPLGKIDLNVKPREWLLGRRFIKRYLTVTVGPPGTSKSTLGMLECLAVASGTNLTGDQPHITGRTWVYNNEDPLDELARRASALCSKFEIDPVSISDSFHLNSGRDRRLMVATELNGSTLFTPDAEALKAEIERMGIVLMTIDPFVRVHQVNENDNGAIDKVADLFSRIAAETGCAFNLIHHTRKPGVASSESFIGDPDSSRGASSLIGAARIVSTLYTMSAADAERMAIPKAESRLYVRLDEGKANMSPPASEARWFKRVGVKLQNGPLGTEGDEVGILEPWNPPETNTSISVQQATQILKRVDDAWGRGAPYKQRRVAGSACILDLMKDAGFGDTASKSIVATWLANGILTTEVFDTNTKKTGLRVLSYPGATF